MAPDTGGRYRVGAKRRARAFRQSTRRRVARRACAAGPWLDSRGSCRRSRDVAFGLLCAVHPRRWTAADGISDRLAHGSCEEPIAQPRLRNRTSRGARRLWLCKHLQHRIRLPRWDVTNAIRSGAHRALISSAVGCGRPETRKTLPLCCTSDNATQAATRRLDGSALVRMTAVCANGWLLSTNTVLQCQGRTLDHRVGAGILQLLNLINQRREEWAETIGVAA